MAAQYGKNCMGYKEVEWVERQITSG